MSPLKVFLYEFVTAGGWHHVASGPPDGSLLAEGRAMLQAIATDFAALDNVHVSVMWDTRLTKPPDGRIELAKVGSADEELKTFARLVSDCDHTLIIAPEIDNWLVSKTRTASKLDGLLLSPNVDFIKITSDKSLTAERLCSAGVPTPQTIRYRFGNPVPVHLGDRLIVKPNDGAGSADIRELRTTDLEGHVSADDEYCVQEFCSGLPASVATICRQDDRIMLPACWQSIQPTTFRYQGGRTIQDPSICQRLNRLAQATLDSLPPTLGYVGIDLLVGGCLDGSLDRVIEVNPRLTTSYVGLRATAQGNLAEAMLSAVDDREINLSFRGDAVEFSASGNTSGGGAG
ncbi:MAG: ATP-grasp domain-containing protein [Planctomycetaceae bacterium]|nr:ATP-grasp domain-containing protein [Planctomycetaceae bacterium]